MKIHIRPRAAVEQARHAITVRPATVAIKARPMRILDFDIENRPLSYLGSDFTTGEVTAISWAWCHDPHNVVVRLLGEDDLIDILHDFVADYDQADMVTGHYITGHDLPMLNGALMELQMPALQDKLVQDTKCDLIRAKGISRSQESLGAMFRLDEPKVQMNQSKWRAANRLTPEGLAMVRERVTGDVKQHMALRKQLEALGYLSAPKLWKSGTAKVEAYTP